MVMLDLDADRWHLGISVTGLFVFAASVKPRTRSATSGPEDHVVFGRALRFELLIAKLCCSVGAVSLCRVRRVCLSRITLGFIRGQPAEYGRVPICLVRCATISALAQFFCAQRL